MHFTTSALSLILAITGVQAVAIESRQVGHVSGQTFSNTGCQDRDLVGTFDFLDDGSSSCKPTNFGSSVKSIRVNLNAATRNFNVYNRTDCKTFFPTVGNVVTWPAQQGQNMGCKSQSNGLNSYDFGPVDA